MTETISTQYTVREMLDALKISVPPTTFLLDSWLKSKYRCGVDMVLISVPFLCLSKNII